MNSRLTIITGPAGCGKSERLRDRYLAALKAARERRLPGRTLWISPTRLAAREAANEIFEGIDDVVLSPNIFTFATFAERILQASPEPVRMISPTSASRLLRSAIDRLAKSGELDAFGTITRTSGFLDLVDRFIAELKRDEIWPEVFASACEARGATPKDRQLGRIYEFYQTELLARDLYDAEGRFWSARQALANGHHRPFEQVECVVIDGFTDFTRTQIEILRLMTGWIPEVHVSLPLETPLRRADLFAKSRHACDQLLEFESTDCRVEVRSTDVKVPTRSRTYSILSAGLFDNPRDIVPVTPDDDLEIWAAMGTRAEQRAVAARIKQLLLDGVPADDIVVAHRSGDGAEATDWRRFFGNAGIPAWCDSGPLLLQHPLVKAVFSVIDVEVEQWAFPRLMALLDAGHFRPLWPEAAVPDVVRETDRRLRRYKLYRQRHAILDTMDRRAARETADESSAGSIVPSVAGLLHRLSEELEPFRRSGTMADWSQRIVAVARELGFAPAGDDHDATTDDQSVWETFRGLLFEAAQADETFNEIAPRYDLSGFRAQLREILSEQRLPPGSLSPGQVKILDASQARHLSVPYLFVVGLTEDAFPRNRSDDCLYSEVERRELNHHGLTLGHGASQQQDEMLLFYGLLTSYRRHLVLSYPESDQRGLPRFAGSYLRTVTDLFSATALRAKSVGRLDPVPEADAVLTAGDVRLIAVEQARRNRPGLFAGRLFDPDTAETYQNVLAAAQAAMARFHTVGFTGYEGHLSNGENIRRLRGRFGADFQFSATQLEQYAICPFRFMVGDVMRVRALESPETTTDPRRRGSMVHELLRELHSELTSPHADEDIRKRFVDLVAEAFGRLPAMTVAESALLNVERQLLEEWADEYARQSKAYSNLISSGWDGPPEIRFLESAFGSPGGADELPPEESPTQLPPLKVGSADAAAYLCGRIDRVDVGQVNGAPAFLVIDYKTGKPPRFSESDLAAGYKLQLAVYLVALRRLGVVAADAKPFQMGYWSMQEDGFVAGLKQRAGRGLKPLGEEVVDRLESILDEVVPKLTDRLRDGEFAVASENDDCTNYCEFRTTCRIAEVRSVKELLAKRLPPLRDGNADGSQASDATTEEL